jgi:hypothetical protein
MEYAVTTYEAIQSHVESMCDSETGCVYLSLEDYASAKEFDDDPTRNCAAGLLNVPNPRAWNSPSAIPPKQAGLRTRNHGRDCEARLVGSYCDSIIDCPKGSDQFPI